MSIENKLNLEKSIKLVRAEKDAQLYNRRIPSEEQKSEIYKIRKKLNEAVDKKLHRNIIMALKSRLAILERRYERQLDADRYWASYNMMYDGIQEFFVRAFVKN